MINGNLSIVEEMTKKGNLRNNSNEQITSRKDGRV